MHIYLHHTHTHLLHAKLLGDLCLDAGLLGASVYPYLYLS